MKEKKPQIIFVLVFVLAFVFRFFNLNWDEGHHLHPDERFLTMVANAISLPQGLVEYFDTVNSGLNPYNNNFSFFSPYMKPLT